MRTARTAALLDLRRTVCAAVILVSALSGACGGSPDAEEPTDPRLTDPLLRPQNYAETAPEQFQVRLETSAGDVLIQVLDATSQAGLTNISVFTL